MDALEKYDLTDEDLNDLFEIFSRMKAKYRERYKDMIAVLYQLTDPETK